MSKSKNQQNKLTIITRSRKPNWNGSDDRVPGGPDDSGASIKASGNSSPRILKAESGNPVVGELEVEMEPKWITIDHRGSTKADRSGQVPPSDKKYLKTKGKMVGKAVDTTTESKAIVAVVEPKGKSVEEGNIKFLEAHCEGTPNQTVLKPNFESMGNFVMVQSC